MRKERDYGLSAEIILLKECPHRHRQIVPPDRKAQKYRVISCHDLRVDMRGDRGAYSVVKLVFGTVKHIVLRIGDLGDDAEQLPARLFGNPICHGLRVARPGEIGNQNFAFPLDGGFRIVCYRGMLASRRTGGKQKECCERKQDRKHFMQVFHWSFFLSCGFFLVAASARRRETRDRVKT